MSTHGLFLNAFLVLNPIIVTTLIAAVAALVLRSVPLRRVRRKILLAVVSLFAAYASVDTAFAVRRVAYAWQSPDEPVVVKKIMRPRSIVLVDLQCDRLCLDVLVSGQHDEVLEALVQDYDGSKRINLPPPYAAKRYRIERTAPSPCPGTPGTAVEQKWTAPVVARLWANGTCPVIETADTPSHGVFFIREGVIVPATARAASFEPRFLATRPPGAVSRFFGYDVQRRIAGQMELLASYRTVEGPGFLGLPPLIGCWDRPDNVAFVLPPGDTGCGLWRLLATGGGRSGKFERADWMYSLPFE